MNKKIRIVRKSKFCLVCGILAKEHLRCKGCKIFIGEKHISKEVNSEGFCKTCERNKHRK